MSPRHLKVSGVREGMGKVLSKDWMIEGLVDFEYKKYQLLSYLKDVEDDFRQQRLYPFFGELVEHYDNLVTFERKREFLMKNFPKEVTVFDFEEWDLVQKKVVEDNNLMKELTKVISYASKQFKKYLQEGQALFEFACKAVKLHYLHGKEADNRTSGYLFCRSDKTNEVKAYQYEVTVFDNNENQFGEIKTRQVDSIEGNVRPQELKSIFLSRHRIMNNPTMVFVEADMPFPFEQTVFPVIKRKLVYLVVHGEGDEGEMS